MPTPPALMSRTRQNFEAATQRQEPPRRSVHKTLQANPGQTDTVSTLVSGMPMAAGCEGNLLLEAAGCDLFLCGRLPHVSVVVHLGFI